MSKLKKKLANGNDVLATDVLCATCIQQEIEVIRSSVISNEKLNDQMRAEIDDVFDKCKGIQESRHPANSQRECGGPNTSPIEEEDASRLYTIKDLALQLQKLAILNSRLKQNDIERSRQLLNKRVASLQAKVDETSLKIKEKESQVQRMRETIINQHRAFSNSINERTLKTRYVDSSRAAKLTAIIQYHHFKVLRQVVFPKYDLWKSQPPGSRSSRVKLDFFGQPILPLESFLLHNNKLIAINMFLENLIHLQVLMVELLSFGGTPVHLPFLDFLVHQLPDGKFFDQVQEKINFLVHDESDANSVEKEPSEEEANKLSGPRPSLDKIIIKDNVIQVPLSFKTANFQRRASVRPALPESPPTELFHPDVFLETPEPPYLIEDKKPQSEKVKSSTFQGKKMVIVPHKILTKPFTKLTLKEYLKFILVVVKILVNFEILIHQTIEAIPQPIKKQSTRDLLSSTYGQLRGEPDTKSENKDQRYDLRKILESIAEMDRYFKHRIQEQSVSLKPEVSHGAMNYSMLTGVGVDIDQLPSASSSGGTEDSFPHTAHASLHTHESSSKLREFYSNYLSRTPLQPKVQQHSITDSDQKIYGAVSEGFLDTDEDTSKSSIKVDRSAEPDSTSKNGIDFYDLKDVMDNVHKLVANGKGGGRDNGDDDDEAVKIATQTMMKNTKSHLADWDVVSRLY